MGRHLRMSFFKEMYLFHFFVKNRNGGEGMSPKELLYIEDALGHEEYLKKQCTEVASKLQDAELKEYVNQLVTKHNELFQQFYNLL